MTVLPANLPNWTLGEKKAIKVKAGTYTAAGVALKAKFGQDWSLVVDFGAFGEYTKDASSSYRADPGKYISKFVLN